MINSKLIQTKKLSAREGEVAKYLMIGKGTNFIAKELGVKANTVSTVKKNIFKKIFVCCIILKKVTLIKFLILTFAETKLNENLQ